MIMFSNPMQLLNLAHVKNLTKQVVRHGSVSSIDDIFTASHKSRCCSRLRPIEPGIADLKPAWKIPGTTEKVQNVKMAAVLVPLCFINKEPSILLTVRSSQLLGHKGEVRYIITKFGFTSAVNFASVYLACSAYVPSRLYVLLALISFSN